MSKNMPSQYIEEGLVVEVKHFARFGGCMPYS